MAYKKKKDQKKAARRYYERNKEKMKACAREFDRRRVATMREWVRKLKESNPCTDCGKSFPYYVMQFDHVRGVKVHNVADIAGTRKSMKVLEDEIAKCELVCANCHAVRTYMRKVGVLKSE